jgi:secreted trypsin-like serine protease
LMPLPGLALSPAQADPHVIGGKDVPEGKYPFMASLQSHGRHTCGATILTETTILTAAHCLKRFEDNPDLEVVIGATKLTKKDAKYVFKLASYRRHPKYEQENKDPKRQAVLSDLAILKLADKIDFGDGKRATQVCLPTLSDKPDIAKCLVVGWGQTMGGLPTRNHSDTLQEAPLSTLTHDQCNRYYPHPESILCMWGGASKSMCFQDDGGPLLCPVEGGKDGPLLQYGIASYALSVACNDKPQFFTRVASYIDWIKKQGE